MEPRKLIQKKIDPIGEDLIELVDKEIEAALADLAANQPKPMDVCRTLFKRALLTPNGIKVATTDTKKLLQICRACREALINTGHDEFVPINLKRSRTYVFLFFDKVGESLDQAAGGRYSHPEGVLPEPGIQRDSPRPGSETLQGHSDTAGAEAPGSPDRNASPELD